MWLNGGKDLFSRVYFDTASNGTGSYAPANYAALTENATAPAAGNTSLTGELNAGGGGLNRAQMTYAHTNGTGLTTLTKTFTKNTADGGTGSPATRTPAKAALFNASSAGTEALETLIPSPPALIDGDSVAITWSQNYS